MKILIKAYWWLFIIVLSIKWMFKVTLGDEIIYEGNKYTVFNGVVSEYWRIGMTKDGKEWWVPRSECKKIWSSKGLIRSFKSGYQFYMSSWYSIWCNGGVKNWMKSCKIW